VTREYNPEITARIKPRLRLDLENEQEMPEIEKKMNKTTG
jgi:hypothetical protein